MAIGVAASSWMYYEGGIYDRVNATVNHAVLLVGYSKDDNGEKYYKIRNSWGPGFGEGGECDEVS